MDAIFSFTPQDSYLVNILNGHSKFTKNKVHKQLVELYNTCDNTSKTLLLKHYDVYSLQVVCFSTAYILVSISPIFQAQVTTKAVPN